ncbi:MAG: shikimate dehydrogenase [Bacteroidia bacterium]|nr:MAG: shikimate dehydrogenase [Bacteroidia bacterium]
MTIYGLIGYPLSHSFSRKYFLQKIKSEGLAHTDYLNFPLQNIAEINRLISGNPRIAGLNVTSPHKQTIIRYLDELSPEAQKAGAVNLVKIIRQKDQKKSIGYNTDIFGFQQSLTEHLPPNCKRTALIAGTGGAARAVSVALNNLGFSYHFVSRKKKTNNTLIYNELSKECLQDITLIVNATPLGMYPRTEEKPNLPYDGLHPEHILFDLIYNPSESAFLQEGKKRKCLIINGLKMLHYQADKAWEIFLKK